MTVRVVIADDQHLVRAGFQLILATQPDIEVVGQATTGSEAVSVAAAQHPDVVLMDIRMPGMDGIEATRRIVQARPSTRVLILTTFDLDEYVYDAMRAGASGFLLKDVPPDQLAAAIRMADSGDALLAPTITRRLIEEFVNSHAHPEPPAWLSQLSPREAQVFGLLAHGRSNAEIAQELIVAETTVKTHVARILAKLGVRDRIQAVVLAYETGIVIPGGNAELR
ncbi:MAG TPA: response regulator transcription factor [Acidimicrobiales bacterium]|jgi:DNA-binding NarL/FixJ family response regulator|nr:response regulator transcription factor [Acidimicrobiales bacterium]